MKERGITITNIEGNKLNPVLSTGLCCPDCGTEMEQIDTTYSNINTKRCKVGQHTGDIYKCETCECSWLENFLNNSKLERWAG